MQKMFFNILAVVAVLAVSGSTALWGQATPRTDNDYNERGVRYYDNGDDDRAIADYTQAIRLNPNDAAAYYNLGLAYAAKGDPGRAIADIEAALRINPNYTTARNSRIYPPAGGKVNEYYLAGFLYPHIYKEGVLT